MTRFLALIRSFGLVFPLYVFGIAFIIAGVWEGSQPWGKAALGIGCLITAWIVSGMRR